MLDLKLLKKQKKNTSWLKNYKFVFIIKIIYNIIKLYLLKNIIRKKGMKK